MKTSASRHLTAAEKSSNYRKYGRRKTKQIYYGQRPVQIYSLEQCRKIRQLSKTAKTIDETMKRNVASSYMLNVREDASTGLLLQDSLQTFSPFGIYIHWPFCLSKCPYCDFFSKVKKRTSRINLSMNIAKIWNSMPK